VLEQLSPALRSQLWDYTDEQKPLTVALATLPPNARVQLAQILSQWRAALGVDQSRRLFTEDPAALVERLALYRTGTWWMFYLPEPSDQTRVLGRQEFGIFPRAVPAPAQGRHPARSASC
jgi:hypothetical protein